MSNKLSSDLSDLVFTDDDKVLPVIVQVNDNLIDSDENLIIAEGGTIKAKLSIINSYATELSARSIRHLVDNPRIKKIYYDGQVFAI